MERRSTYRTKQRSLLLTCLEGAKDTHMTAADVCEWCRRQGSPVGQSTVYRQLERLVEEGLVRKYTTGESGPACFAYAGAEVHAEGGSCFHCRCERCGKLFHLHCRVLEGIGAHLRDKHGFRIDPMRTVFYGLCDECRREGR